MNRSSNSHSRMFLMEMMFAILFFSLAGAVCLRMFAASRRMSVSAAELNMAVNQAGNAAELLKNSYRTNASRFPGCILDEYPDAAADGAGITVYYDTNWESCPRPAHIICRFCKQPYRMILLHSRSLFMMQQKTKRLFIPWN